MKSFDVFKFAGCVAVAAIVMDLYGPFPTDSSIILGEILFVGGLVVYAFFLKKVENAEENWNTKR